MITIITAFMLSAGQPMVAIKPKEFEMPKIVYIIKKYHK